MKRKIDIEENECEKCKWYIQHYGKGSSSYVPVNCGHCRNQNKKKKLKPCEFWMENIPIKTEREESIKEVLRNMSRQLREIKQLLKDDKKE